MAQTQRLEDVEADAHLLYRIGRQRDPDRIADSGPQQRTDADRRLHRARDHAARLGDAQVKRIVAGLREALIGGGGKKDVGRLHRYLELAEIVVFQQPRVIERAFHHRFGTRLAVALQQFGLEASGVDADTHRAAMVLGRLHHLAHARRRADIAGIDAQARRACFGRLNGAAVVEMDIGDDRHADGADDRLQRLGRVLVRHRDAHDIGARLLQCPDLPDRRRRVGGDRVGHRLDADRRVAADLDGADPDLAADAARDLAVRPDGAHRLSLPEKAPEARRASRPAPGPALPRRGWPQGPGPGRRGRTLGRRAIGLGRQGEVGDGRAIGAGAADKGAVEDYVQRPGIGDRQRKAGLVGHAVAVARLERAVDVDGVAQFGGGDRQQRRPPRDEDDPGVGVGLAHLASRRRLGRFPGRGRDDPAGPRCRGRFRGGNRRRRRGRRRRCDGGSRLGALKDFGRRRGRARRIGLGGCRGAGGKRARAADPARLGGKVVGAGHSAREAEDDHADGNEREALLFLRHRDGEVSGRLLRRHLGLVAAHDVGCVEAQVVGIGAHEADRIGLAGQQVVTRLLDRLDQILADTQHLAHLRDRLAALQADRAQLHADALVGSAGRLLDVFQIEPAAGRRMAGFGRHDAD